MTELPHSLLKVLEACRALPSSPSVAMKVLDLSQDPDVGTSEVAKVIASDPALTAKVLKVANSPWCGVRAEVTTLERAVNLLGVNGTLSLALSFSLVRQLRNSLGAKFNHLAFWRRSVIAAVATRAFGDQVKAGSRDELFLAGLLQDIGMLAMNEAMPETYGPLVASAKGDHDALVEIELNSFGADHARVGSWLLGKWGLPARLSEAVYASHDRDGNGQPGQIFARSVAVGGQAAEVWVNPDTRSATSAARNAAESQLRIPLDVFERLLGAIAADLPEATMKLDIDIGGETFVPRLLDQAREAIAELNLQALQVARQLQVQAQRDELTSLYNRAYFNQLLQQQFDLSRQTGQPLTVIFLDIDNFKSINDNYGHNAGDAILVSVSRAIKAAVRSLDTLVRFGGDEFVVLLVNTGEETGVIVSERIRSTVEAQNHRAGEETWIQVTVSVGCATMTSNAQFSSEKQLLEAADRSLYEAKTGGRNRVVLAS